MIGFLAGIAPYGAEAEPVELYRNTVHEEVQDTYYSFQISSTDADTSATVDQGQAALRGVEWAVTYYKLDASSIKSMTFYVRPTRFWLLTFEKDFNGTKQMVYAVVLVNGKVVEPVVRLLV
jgi:hypothetical protein